MEVRCIQASLARDLEAGQSGSGSGQQEEGRERHGAAVLSNERVCPR